MRSMLLAMLLLICAQTLRADAQSPSPCAALPKSEDALLLFDINKFAGYDKPGARVDQPPSLFLQADHLIFDKSRVIAQGDVEISYNNCILTADKVTYDERLNKLTAEGNVHLKDPNGQITRTDRLELSDDIRDALVAKLSIVDPDRNNPHQTGPRTEGPRKSPE